VTANFSPVFDYSAGAGFITQPDCILHFPNLVLHRYGYAFKCGFVIYCLKFYCFYSMYKPNSENVGDLEKVYKFSFI